MRNILAFLLPACLLSACQGTASTHPAAATSVGGVPAACDFVVMPGPTNAVQFRLYTNASPAAPHLFNTIEIEVAGQKLLESPRGEGLRRWLAVRPTNAPLDNILINGLGPNLSPTNCAIMTDRTAGPDWSYVALDVSSAYRDRLEQFKRAVLFVEPDLFVVYDHLVSKDPIKFAMILHPPAATTLDTNWGDPHLNLSRATLTVNSPGRRSDPRFWQQIKSPADEYLPGTTTMLLGPTNELADIHVLTVFAVSTSEPRTEYAFKLLESVHALGARIHRDGFPSLVAFSTDPTDPSPSLTGFGFNGPVGVHVFHPKRRPGAQSTNQPPIRPPSPAVPAASN